MISKALLRCAAGVSPLLKNKTKLAKLPAVCQLQHPRPILQQRLFKTTPTLFQQKVTPQIVKDVTDQVLQHIERPEFTEILNNLKQLPVESNADIATKWGQLIQIVLPIQSQAVQQYGFASSQQGVSEYNEAVRKLYDTNPELSKENRRLFETLVDKVFGFQLATPYSDTELRQIVEELVATMEGEEFSKNVDDIARRDGDFGYKRMMLMPDIITAQMNSLKKYGFEGLQAWINFMISLTDFMSTHKDRDFIASVGQKQAALFARLNPKKPEAANATSSSSASTSTSPSSTTTTASSATEK